ncbi:MAG TPA: hypothetical protein IAA11_05195 [Candidatus Blautia intestinigallinarum]|nr:hypothetical protein [Candidatus Blautia intestinigallinarum]
MSEKNTAEICSCKIAELPEACVKKIHEFERELNKQGYWNLALIAYQMKK